MKTLDTISDAEVRTEAFRRCFAEMPVEEWGEWLKKLTEDSSNRRTDKADLRGQIRELSMFEESLRAIASLDPAGFMGHLTSKGERNNDGESTLRILTSMKWAELDPAAAKSWIRRQLSAGDTMAGVDDAAERVAIVLARDGDPGVFAWAQSLPEKERDEALRAAFRQLSVENPTEAAARFAELRGTPGLNEKNAASKIAEQWAKSDPARALEWSGGLSGEAQGEATSTVLSKWASEDYDAALTAWKTLPADALDKALGALISRTPPERMLEASRLVESQPEGAGRAAASGQLMSSWTHQNPEEASAWMKRQPPGEVLDAAITSFVRWADVRDPEAALIWAATVSNSEKRIASIDHIIGQLGGRAPEAVEPWLEANASLTEAERASVKQSLEKRKGR